MSLGGAQDKLLLAGHPGGWALPEDGAPSTWILKPEPDRWPGLAAAEAWALGLASTVTEVCEAHVESSLGRRPVLAVKRYDRSEREGQTVRIHQEDLCQALGLPPSRKYARPGGPPALSPALARLARILRERAVSPDEELMRLLQQVVVSVALRNTDLHGKNLSLVHVQGSVALAPAYDITTTTAFVPAQQHIGLSIGGTFRIDQIAGDQLVLEARSWGMPERIATEVVRSTAAVLRAATAGVMHEIPGLPESVKAIADVGIEAVSVPRPGRAPTRRRATELGRATRTTSADGAEPPA
jgi:serine/threonine-protein kinase HipA